MTLLGDIFTFALRGNGKYILIIGTILAVVADIVSFAPLIGGFAGLFLAGYSCALYYEIIQSSATGGAEAPEYPGASNLMEDIIYPALQCLAVALVSGLPVLGYVWFGPDPRSEDVYRGLLAVSFSYFPMAMLGVVVLGRFSAVSPHIVLPAIFRAGGLYWLAVFLLFVLYMAVSAIEKSLAGMPFIASPVMAVVGMFTLLTQGRILGIIYRERQEELNWL